MMALVYRCPSRDDVAAITALRCSVGWPEMKREYSNSKLQNYFSAACYDENRLVGWLCVVSNGVTDAYVQDLMVAPDYQRRGIGTHLMDLLLDVLRSHGIYMVSVVYGEESLRSFYEKFGFYTMLCGQKELYQPE